jgi:esterase/lipase superfamily enzyme
VRLSCAVLIGAMGCAAFLALAPACSKKKPSTAPVPAPVVDGKITSVVPDIAPGEYSPEWQSLVMTEGFPADAVDDPATEKDERFDALAINDVRRLENDYMQWATEMRKEGIITNNNPDTIPFSMGGLVHDYDFFGGAGDGDMEGGSAAPKEPSGRIRVWYGTNRALVDEKDPSKGFGNTRESDASRLHLGSVICYVPRNREPGSVGSNWLVRTMTGVDDRIKLEKIFLEQPDMFFRQMRNRLLLADPEQRDVVVYVHGYKNSFESAAIRAAQLAVDLNVPGLTAFYSWPSRDAVSEYNADEAAVETAEKHLALFLSRIAKETGAARVHLIAHSMGNRLVTRVMQRLSQTEPTLKFGQIILAAPDIDTQVFADLAAAYPKLSERTTLYVSRKDRALEASSWTHSFPRAGYGPPISVLPGIDTVEVTNIDVSALGHGYVAEQEHVLFDIAMMLRKDTPPTNRPRLRETGEGEKRHWTLEERK